MISNFIKNIIPLKTRKRIKSLIKSVPLFFGFGVPTNIKKEWQDWISNRPKNSYDLINFSIINWDFRIQRPQHLATELAKNNNRVFYIEQDFYSYLNLKSYFAPFSVTKKAENVYVIKLASHKNLFIYNDKPSTLDKKIIITSLKNLIFKAKIINPIAKIDHPFWQNFTEQLAMPTIYDCMDLHNGFIHNNNNIDKLEKELIKNSNLVYTTSKYLLQKINRNDTILLPNAGEYKHFSRKPITIPNDIINISHPIIGYYGALSDWFDTEILENIAKKHSDKSIVLIGQIDNPKISQLANKYSNIILLGEKPYSIIPQYLYKFDVCIIPFILNELIKATHPVKVYEYFATGKPIVSTLLPEINEYSDTIYFANKSNFSTQITNALNNSKVINTKEIDIAKNNTWQQRGELLNKTINKILFPKVSIIILTYNNPQLSKQSIDSVLNNSFYPNMEIIIVDNASKQETVEVVKKYKNIPNVKLILNTINYGFAKGNNIGLHLATGDYLILLNNDILVTPGWISRLIFYDNKPNIGLIGPVTNSIGNEAKVNAKYKNASLYTSQHWGKTISLSNIAAFCWIMSRKVYEQIGDLDERFGRGMFEDDDYCYRIKKAKLDILVSEDVFIHHYGGASFKQIQSEEYQKIFNDNKNKFETKWGIKWIPHKYRND